MTNANTSKFSSRSTDSVNRDTNMADGENLSTPPSLQAQLSLSMGPNVIFGNAIGDPNMQAIVELWRPRFTIKTVSILEELSWR